MCTIRWPSFTSTVDKNIMQNQGTAPGISWWNRKRFVSRHWSFISDSTQKAPFNALLQQIMQKSFSLTTEEVVVPGKPALASLTSEMLKNCILKWSGLMWMPT